MKKQLPNLIRKKRLEKKLSQSELALKIGLKQGQSISNFERGQAPLALKHFKPLAHALGLSVKAIRLAHLNDQKSVVTGKINSEVLSE